MAQRDLCGQRFKIISCLHARGRLPQIAIEDLNAIGMPTQALGTLDEGPLRELTVEMIPHLLGARLADIDDGFALQVEGSDFHLTERESGMHGLDRKSVV